MLKISTNFTFGLYSFAYFNGFTVYMEKLSHIATSKSNIKIIFDDELFYSNQFGIWITSMRFKKLDTETLIIIHGAGKQKLTEKKTYETHMKK